MRPGGDNPVPDSSIAHPVVTLVTISAMVLFVQGAEAQMFVTQLLRGSMTEVFVPEISCINEDGLRQAAASESVAIWASEVVQLDERLRGVNVNE